MSTSPELLRLSDSDLVRAFLRHVQPRGALTQSAAARALAEVSGAEVSQVTVGRWVLGEERGEPVQQLSAHTRRALERYMAAHPLPMELADAALVDRFVARITAERLSVRKAEERLREAAGGAGGASASWISRWKNGVRPTQGLSDATRSALQTYLGETNELMSNGTVERVALEEGPPSWREVREWLDRETRAAEMRAHEAIAAERRAVIFDRLLAASKVEHRVSLNSGDNCEAAAHGDTPNRDQAE